MKKNCKSKTKCHCEDHRGRRGGRGNLRKGVVPVKALIFTAEYAEERRGRLKSGGRRDSCKSVKSLNAESRRGGPLVDRSSRRVSQLNLKLNQEFKV